jgi:hypothetical protein
MPTSIDLANDNHYYLHARQITFACKTGHNAGFTASVNRHRIVRYGTRIVSEYAGKMIEFDLSGQINPD